MYEKNLKDCRQNVCLSRDYSVKDMECPLFLETLLQVPACFSVCSLVYLKCAFSCHYIILYLVEYHTNSRLKNINIIFSLNKNAKM